MSRMSKAERECILPVLELDLVHEPAQGTDAAEFMRFVREHMRQLLADANAAEERIAELETEVEAKISLIGKLERENARIHELYGLDRDEYKSRGGA